MQKHAHLPEPFAELGIEVRFLKAVHKMGFETPSDVQAQLIPPALAGRDILGQAQTGTGKTAAFSLPILQRMDPAGRIQALCLAPTRELAVQVAAETQRLAEFANLRIVPIYGGQKIAKQVHALGRKPHFVVGTPGRVKDMVGRRMLDLRGIRFAVLDEVDRMLDIGFRDDIREILGFIRGTHQTIFVSATLTDEIKRLSRKFMHDPIEVNVSRDTITVDEVHQSYVSVERFDKFRALRLILEQEDPPVAIIFCNTKATARKLTKKLYDAGFSAKEIHGDLIQAKRDRVMSQFRKHQVRILVATDLAARGIDVSSITHIFNYDIPPDPEVYVHRIGRTARMGAKGVAITFVAADQGKELTNVEMLINRQVPERNVDGFVPRPPREESPESAKPSISRNEALRYPGDGQAVKSPPRKTLGGRFKTRRRRRL
ncbi:MAG: DEAD/DEAH box helicase [Phycisphaerae bacterium]